MVYGQIISGVLDKANIGQGGLPNSLFLSSFSFFLSLSRNIELQWSEAPRSLTEH